MMKMCVFDGFSSLRAEFCVTSKRLTFGFCCNPNKQTIMQFDYNYSKLMNKLSFSLRAVCVCVDEKDKHNRSKTFEQTISKDMNLEFKIDLQMFCWLMQQR